MSITLMKRCRFKLFQDTRNKEKHYWYFWVVTPTDMMANWLACHLTLYSPDHNNLWDNGGHSLMIMKRGKFLQKAINWNNFVIIFSYPNINLIHQSSLIDSDGKTYAENASPYFYGKRSTKLITNHHEETSEKFFPRRLESSDRLPFTMVACEKFYFIS